MIDHFLPKDHQEVQSQEGPINMYVLYHYAINTDTLNYFLSFVTSILDALRDREGLSGVQGDRPVDRVGRANGALCGAAHTRWLRR